MTTCSNNIRVDLVNPKDLSKSEFHRFGEVIQDVFSSNRWIGEFVKCTNSECGEVFSREEISWKFPVQSYKTLVAKIMKHEGPHIPCALCGSDMVCIYDHNKIEQIRQRLIRETSILVVCRDGDRPVGWMEGVIGPLESIYEWELKDHYSLVWIPVIRQKINAILGYDSQNFLSLSSVGLAEWYDSFSNVFQILNKFFHAVPSGYVTTPWIAELNKKSNLHTVNKIMGAISLGIGDSPELKEKISHTGKEYDSEIVVFHKATERFKDNFSMGFKSFLKKYWSMRREEWEKMAA